MVVSWTVWDTMGLVGCMWSDGEWCDVLGKTPTPPGAVLSHCTAWLSPLPLLEAIGASHQEQHLTSASVERVVACQRNT